MAKKWLALVITAIVIGFAVFTYVPVLFPQTQPFFNTITEGIRGIGQWLYAHIFTNIATFLSTLGVAIGATSLIYKAYKNMKAKATQLETQQKQMQETMTQTFTEKMNAENLVTDLQGKLSLKDNQISQLQTQINNMPSFTDLQTKYTSLLSDYEQACKDRDIFAAQASALKQIQIQKVVP